MTELLAHLEVAEPLERLDRDAAHELGLRDGRRAGLALDRRLGLAGDEVDLRANARRAELAALRADDGLQTSAERHEDRLTLLIDTSTAQSGQVMRLADDDDEVPGAASSASTSMTSRALPLPDCDDDAGGAARRGRLAGGAATGASSSESLDSSTTSGRSSSAVSRRRPSMAERAMGEA